MTLTVNYTTKPSMWLLQPLCLCPVTVSPHFAIPAQPTQGICSPAPVRCQAHLRAARPGPLHLHIGIPSWKSHQEMKP